MDPLQVLATELVLDILRYVSLPDLASVQRLNKAWHELFTSNQHAIFKDTALNTLHVQPPCDHPDAKHDGWKQVCQCDVSSHLMRKHKIITVDHVPYSTDFHPWRIKIDRPHQLLFASTADLPSDFLPDPTRPMDLPYPHGLTVVDLRTKRVIQTIPEVKQYAHLEYDSGYLVTTGNGTRALFTSPPHNHVLREVSILGDTMSIYRTPWAVQPTTTTTPASPQSARPETEPPPTNDESDAARDEHPLSVHGTITSRGYRALRMMGRTLATASDTRIQIFGKSIITRGTCFSNTVIDTTLWAL
ncbi:hypothetical protein QFC19_003664 [Naganishia cerealis]|uniref:Uncharacterized protein n=1 Tax=Naganishia cerealis TaxID=610337 RepID=A0ACC2W0X1_9TREE|nr:hypothetical protein QFC19_003664 [Naganishia cerealis]